MAGTLIDTPEGGWLAEHLAPGDRITTPDGTAQPVAWTASRRRDTATRAGALGSWRDLLITPQPRSARGPLGAPASFAPAPLACRRR